MFFIVAMTTRPVEMTPPTLSRDRDITSTINASPRCAASEPNFPHGAESRPCQQSVSLAAQ